MVYGVIPADKQEFIHALPGGCRVARYVQITRYGYDVQYALNWEDLEPQAHAVVEQIVGAITEVGRYPCPPELAAQAVWPQ